MERMSLETTRGWSPSDRPTVTLHDVMTTLRRQRWSVLGVTLVVTMLAAAYSLTRTPTYTSTAEVLARSTLTSPFDSNSDVNLQTESRVVTSTAVAEIARTLLDSSASPEQLLDRVSVTVPPGAEVMEVTFSDTDPASARAGAEAFAEAYLRFRSQQATETVARFATSLQTQIGDLDEQIAVQNRAAGELDPNSRGWREAMRELNSLEAMRISLQQQLATATTVSVDPGQVIQNAELPSSPSSPRHGFDIAMGLFLGLVLGVVVALARDRYRDRITDADALEQSIGVPVLGLVPRLRASRRRPVRLIALTEPTSGAAEAYRALRTNLLAVGSRSFSSHRPLTTILVTSAEMAEGKTTTAANLAVCLALAGKEVVLIDADMRYPSIHALFDMPNDEGLAQVLAGELSVADSVRISEIPHLKVLTSGAVSRREARVAGEEGAITLLNPAELLQSGAMLEVLTYCRDAEFVLIDSPPVLGVADSLPLASMVDGIIIVADASKGTAASVGAAAYQLNQAGGHLVGGVLNAFDPAGAAAGYGSNDYRIGLMYRRRVSRPSEGNGSAPDSESEKRHTPERGARADRGARPAP
ncbi:MAG TPA: polysaccharide biosynthesis tyrosine autokinase [Actinomycetota bacterium]|nr:polysaccharide biosynthesis tyrosine autokinase [Actinomycetota bacterium]